MSISDIHIIGAGIFGVTAALELQQRGHQVTLIDPGPLPHPLAASTDISKVVRLEYGTDEQYMLMVNQAIDGWHNWNEQWAEPLYHQTGVTMLTRQPMAPGGFEYESYQLMRQHGLTPQRLSADDITHRFPAWQPGAYVDGYFHARGGFAQSGQVVTALLAQAQRIGVQLLAGTTIQQLNIEKNRLTALITTANEKLPLNQALLAAGPWTPYLLPELKAVMRPSGHPVFHLKPANPQLFTPPNFVVFTADITNTGWYGFPLHPSEKVIKIANHGVGQQLHPTSDPRLVTPQDEAHLRAFLATTFPALVDAPIVYTRRCLYCDTLDEHFWIDHHPTIRGLAVASGGSGHGFKFAPILGPLIADMLDHQPNPWLAKFQWRDLTSAHGEEAARYHG
ncbi:MAG TPA: FAD-dependent oxidoreductase [Anaerolineae bacterium]|nr:FAD-dependent oxidoreductase [Anaerolineae bacterium]